MRIFSNNHYTSKEETTKNDERYMHEFDLNKEQFEAC